MATLAGAAAAFQGFPARSQTAIDAFTCNDERDTLLFKYSVDSVSLYVKYRYNSNGMSFSLTFYNPEEAQFSVFMGRELFELDGTEVVVFITNPTQELWRYSGSADFFLDDMAFVIIQLPTAELMNIIDGDWIAFNPRYSSNRYPRAAPVGIDVRDGLFLGL